MVKESERKRVYHTRAAHKEDCQCAPCKQKRLGAEKGSESISQEIPLAALTSAAVPLGSLNTKDLFTIDGERYRMGEKTPEVAVCHKLSFRSNGPDPADQMWLVVKTCPLGLGTMVHPVK